MPSKTRHEAKSPGIVIISEGAPDISVGSAALRCGSDRCPWASEAKSEDLLFILDHAPFGIIVNQGETGKVVYKNPEIIRISGYTDTEACDVEAALQAMTPPYVDLRAKMDQLRRIEAAGGGIYLDEIITKDGTRKIVEASAIVLPDKTRVAIWTDVTRREEAERALREVNSELENRVEERTTALQEINRKLHREIRERKRVEQELKRSREELRLLSEHLQRAREEERLSLSREVHDELGQRLSVMKIDASVISRNAPKRNGLIKDHAGSLEQQIDDAIQAVRDICSRLRPSVLVHFGLPAAIDWYLEDFQKRTGLKCRSEVDVGAPLEGTALSLVLFRILQEAMTNILRHAEATEASVSLRVSGDDIVLTVRDNGRGITPEQMMKPQSFGIIGIRERVRFWGGTSVFEGNSGTTVTVSIPIGNAKEPSISVAPAKRGAVSS